MSKFISILIRIAILFVLAAIIGLSRENGGPTGLIIVVGCAIFSAISAYDRSKKSNKTEEEKNKLDKS
ncbi:hypothetical protein EDL98_00925 [Ornithobacterium rhinotracheale]|uniref:hypothetical protein n=1 Tax=Ornithobacterium rhinotracheale TaxID=28251 RepID=UPI00129C2CEF|nr:hypothetical protein [Ornithobacterium rhinotracheale]MRJ09655.1 hypothetical protein [Ornithobacterium rhinotracheale]